MKRISMYFALALFVSVLAGCSNSSNPTAQMQDEPALTAPATNVSLIQLPEPAVSSLQKKTTKTALVTPEEGGDINIVDTYKSVYGSEVSVNMTLHFEPGTVDEATMVSVTLKGRTLIAEFSPSGLQFKKPAILSASISGIDFSGIPENVEFGLYYIDGPSYVKMNASVNIDRTAGTLTLTNGEVPHFSLYGFGFTK